MNDFLYGMLIFCIMVFFVLCKSEKKECKEVDYKEIRSGITLSKVEFEGHQYLFLKNIWNSAGDKLLHDPNCKCKKIKTKVD